MNIVFFFFGFDTARLCVLAVSCHATIKPLMSLLLVLLERSGSGGDDAAVGDHDRDDDNDDDA